MRCRITVSRLSFLKRQLVENASGIGAAAMSALIDDPDSLCLVRECKELEMYFGTMYTDEISS